MCLLHLYVFRLSATSTGTMKITVIGASAGVGLQATRLALEKGHEVATLSRRVVPLPDHTKLKRMQGSATSVNDVRVAVEGAGAILVTLGVKSPFATTLFSDSARILLRVLQDNGSSPPGTCPASGACPCAAGRGSAGGRRGGVPEAWVEDSRSPARAEGEQRIIAPWPASRPRRASTCAGGTPSTTT